MKSTIPQIICKLLEKVWNNTWTRADNYNNYIFYHYFGEWENFAVIKFCDIDITLIMTYEWLIWNLFTIIIWWFILQDKISDDGWKIRKPYLKKKMTWIIRFHRIFTCFLCNFSVFFLFLLPKSGLLPCGALFLTKLSKSNLNLALKKHVKI